MTSYLHKQDRFHVIMDPILKRYRLYRLTNVNNKAPA